MRHCPACGIKVSGDFRYCPLCQNELLGEKSEYCFPPPQKLRSISLLYKIQLFASFTAVMISLALDFLFDLHFGFHWSIVAAAGVLAAQIVTWRLLRRHSGVYYFIVNIGAGLIALLLFVSWYPGIRELCFLYILPSLFIAIVGSLFVLCLFDRSGNVMPYLLAAIVFSLITPALICSEGREPPLFWDICIMTDTVVAVGIVIFKGSIAANELRKRFHM